MYLDVDQSKQTKLNRGFEKQLKEMIAGIQTTVSRNELAALQAACERMEFFVQKFAIGGHGLVAVFDTADGFFWSGQLDVPVPSRLQWGRGVLIQPLLDVLDELENIGIVLVDRASMRIVSMFLGEVHEQARETFDDRKVRHTKTAGMDHLGADSHAQQKADEKVRLNLRNMIKRIEAVTELRSFRHLILAGSTEITAQLRSLLPKRLASLVIGTVDLATNANLKAIRKAAAPIAEKYERESEQALISDLVTASAKGGAVVVGLGHTLHAVNQGRIWQLVYSDRCHWTGSECRQCGALFSRNARACSFCGSPVDRVADVVERAVAHAARKGAKVDVIRGEQAEAALMNAGGVGAFLRTRRAAS